MKKTCTDRKLGIQLHAYELGALSPHDVELFEKHLMTCDYCFSEASRFVEHAALLRRGSLVRRELGAVAGGALSDEPWTLRLKRYLWPQMPLAFRPAMLMLIILLLIYPAYLSLKTSDSPVIRPVVGIMLYPSRSAGETAQRFRADSDLILSFVCEEARPGQSYRVTLADEKGEQLWHSDSFVDFDNYGSGHVLLPGNLVKAGRYKLTILSVDSTSPTSTYEYNFYLIN